MAQRISNLPVGAKVKFGKHSINGETPWDIIWAIVDKNHGGTPAYPTNSVTLASYYLVDIRAYDAVEPKNPLNASASSTRAKFGNNYYSVSNIDQWLNSDAEAGQWYVARHSYDQSPDRSDYLDGEATQYANRPGFLKHFSTEEKDAILNTTLKVMIPDSDGGGTEEIVRKVFLPSRREYDPSITTVQSDSGRKNTWDAQLSIKTYCTKCLSQQIVDYSPYDTGNSNLKLAFQFMTRDTDTPNDTAYWGIHSGNVAQKFSARDGSKGVLPVLNLSNTAWVSDTTDADGCYTFYANHKPSQPTAITVPSTILGGKLNAISWSESVDADAGDSVTYVLECSYNGGNYNSIYSGTSRSYSHSVDSTKTSVRYRIKAIDNYGAESAYTTSDTRTILNNNAPTISGSDSNLGTKTGEFNITYTVGDADGHSVTVVEAIDGVQVRSYVATLNATNTFAVTGGTWLKLQNGSHTLTITAKDSYDTTVRTYAFVKNINSLSVQNSTPLAASSMPTRITVSVTRSVASGAIFKVEVCNNGFDTSPTWEDATDAVRSGLVHVFKNTSRTAAKWGVLVRVTVERNGATGACYISAIGGNFE